MRKIFLIGAFLLSASCASTVYMREFKYRTYEINVDKGVLIFLFEHLVVEGDKGL